MYYRPTGAVAVQTARPAKHRLRRKPLVLIVALILGLGAFTYVAGHSAAAIPEIKSGFAGMCLDDFHNSAAANAKVDIWQCNGTPAQAWLFKNDNLIHNRADCLTITGTNPKANTPLAANSCNGGANQVWVSAIGGFENPSSALCAAVGNPANGSPLVAASCNRLTTKTELWQPATWKAHDTTPATISCQTGGIGQRVACNAAKQWIAWQANPANHANLLNLYSDGNGYEEWCADFVSYIYKVSGDPFTNGERNGWDEYLAYDVANENFTYHSAANYTPQTGDVAFFNYNGGHVEIVAIGGAKPVFIYGDSGTIDPATGNGTMAENTITNDGAAGQVQYYLSPN